MLRRRGLRFNQTSAGNAFRPSATLSDPSDPPPSGVTDAPARLYNGGMTGLSYEQSGVRCTSASTPSSGPASGRRPGRCRPWRRTACQSRRAFAAKALICWKRRRIPRPCRGGAGNQEPGCRCDAKLTGASYYRAIGIDTVATIVNDIITVRRLPVSVAMHAAVGDGLVRGRAARGGAGSGFAEGCRRAGAVWGGGETPTLRGIIEPDTVVLAGSAVGRMRGQGPIALPAMWQRAMRSSSWPARGCRPTGSRSAGRWRIGCRRDI